MTRPKAFVHTHRLALVAAFLSLVAFAPAHAEDFTFSIDPQDLSAALKLFAVQSHREIFFAPEIARGKKSMGIKGTVDDIKALRAILEGTGLNFSVTASRAILVNGASKSSSSQVGASTTSGSAPRNPSIPARLAQSNTANSQSLASSTGPQSSQDVPANSSKSEDSKGLAEILVKGSRIMNVDVTRTADDPQPYYIFDSQTIDQSAATSVEDFLKQQLTMNTTFATNQQSPNSIGGNTSSINLRGLGVNETLILIDGRRSANVTIDGTSGQPDLNGIPLAAIERIEVLPSSASAIYGGAALGGVVNVILKKDFQGGELRYTDNIPTGGDGQQRTLNATYGFTLPDTTRIMVTGQYSDGTPLLLGDRLNLFRRGLSNVLANSPSDVYGSGSPFPGATPNITGVDANFNPTNLTLRNGTPLNSPITSVPAGSAPGSDISAGLLANAGTYNFGLAPGTGQDGLQQPLNSTPLVKSFMATLRRELTSNLEVFTEFSTQSNSSIANVNPFGGIAYIPSSAPDNPFQQGVIITFPSAASTQNISDNVTQSATVGLIARLPAAWSSEIDYTWSRSDFSYQYHPVDGLAASSAFSAGTLNPFVDTIAHPLKLMPYSNDFSGGGTGTLSDLALRASGPIGSLPWGRPNLTIGLEHRKEGFADSFQTLTDPSTPANNYIGEFRGEPQTVNSVYAEALVPLVTNLNAIPLVRSLELQLAVRSEMYTVDASTNFQYLGALQIYNTPVTEDTVRYTSTNPTIALKYKPVASVTIRSSFAKAFLPPQASQLLPNPQSACGGVPCILITDPKNGQSYDVDFFGGGNPQLRPQTSQDWDFGAIWEPTNSLLQGARFNLQYYQIRQPNYIILPSIQQVVSDPGLTSRVTRDPVTGRITLVDDSYLNATLYKTNGFDLTIDYTKSTSLGTFNWHAAGTLIKHDLRQFAIGGPLNEYVGFPADGGEARIKANATFSWDYKHWSLGWITVYTSSYYQQGSPNDPSFVTPFYTAGQGGFSIPSQIYHSIFGGYKFTEGVGPILSNLQIQGSIKNVFSTLPPYDFSGGSAYYSYYGDPRLRTFWISIRKAFGARN